MTKATFQKFIDEEIFPGTFTNIVHPVMEGAAVPSACFPVTGIDAWVDATMKKIEEVRPPALGHLATISRNHLPMFSTCPPSDLATVLRKNPPTRSP